MTITVGEIFIECSRRNEASVGYTAPVLSLDMCSPSNSASFSSFNKCKIFLTNTIFRVKILCVAY